MSYPKIVIQINKYKGSDIFYIATFNFLYDLGI